MTSFNNAQLATYDEARQLASLFNALAIGGGVRPGDDENGVTEVINPAMPWLPSVHTFPGVYVPVWLAGPSGFQVPFADGPPKRYFLHFRLMNGLEGVNVGLVRERFLSYPTAPGYVVGQLKQELR